MYTKVSNQHFKEKIVFKVGDKVWVHRLNSDSLGIYKTFSVVTWVHNKEVRVRLLDVRFCLQTGVRKYNSYCEVAKHEKDVLCISKVTEEESKQYKKAIQERSKRKNY